MGQPGLPQLVFDSRLAGEYFRHGMHVTRHARRFTVPSGLRLAVSHQNGDVRVHRTDFYGFFDPTSSAPDLITSTLEALVFERGFQRVHGALDTWESRPVLAYQVTAEMLEGTDGTIAITTLNGETDVDSRVRVGRWLVQEHTGVVQVIPCNTFASGYYAFVRQLAA
jgi:hypothetical protein